MQTLNRIGILSAAKILAIIELVVGFISAIFIFVFRSAFTVTNKTSRMGFLGHGIGIIVAVPIVAFIVGFIVIAIEAWLYDVLAGRLGGLKVNITKNKLKSVDLISTGRIYAAGAAIVGFVAGIITSIFGLTSGSHLFAIFGVASIVLFPIIFAIVAFVAAVIGFAIYNFLAKNIGGIGIYFKKDELVKIDPMSYAKIQSVFGAIIGLILGFAASIGSLIAPASTMIPTLAHNLGLFSIIVYPIFYFIISFLASFVGAWVYNYLVPHVGGIRIKLV